MKIHKDCPLTQEEIDETYNDLLNVATANGCPTHPLWAKGHQRHIARQMEKQGERLARLKRLHATALGLYMAARILGRDGEVQKHRLERIASELSKYDINRD